MRLVPAALILLAAATTVQADTKTKVFGVASLNGALVNACLTSHGPCGQRAAKKFCVAAGYTAVDAFDVKLTLKPSVYLQSGEKCVPIPGAVAGPHCEVLVNITCSKTNFAKEPGLPAQQPQ